MLPNGETVSLDLTYRGQDPDGMHVWEVTLPVKVSSLEDLQLAVDVMPARTTVVVGVEE